MSPYQFCQSVLPGLSAAWVGNQCFIVHPLYIKSGQSVSAYSDLKNTEADAWEQAADWLKILGK